MFAKLILFMLHAVTITHLNHLTETSYARHVALGDFYTELGILVDQLAEALTGITGQKLMFVADGFTILLSEEIIRLVVTHLETNYQQFPQGTKAIVDEILLLCNGTLYKLTQLT